MADLTTRFDYDSDLEIPDDVEPIGLLQRWLADAAAASAEPGAMCLATIGPEGPSARFVLLRAFDAGALIFYSNRESRKGQDLADDPRAAATFWWPELHRQVRIEGRVTLVTEEVSDAYFASRPVESQWASAASPQSRVVASNGEVQSRVDELRKAWPNGPPRPEHWGGYSLAPTRIEFWIGRPARLHDRLLFERNGTEWQRTLLAP